MRSASLKASSPPQAGAPQALTGRSLSPAGTIFKAPKGCASSHEVTLFKAFGRSLIAVDNFSDLNFFAVKNQKLNQSLRQNLIQTEKPAG